MKWPLLIQDHFNCDSGVKSRAIRQIVWEIVQGNVEEKANMQNILDPDCNVTYQNSSLLMAMTYAGEFSLTLGRRVGSWGTCIAGR